MSEYEGSDPTARSAPKNELPGPKLSNEVSQEMLPSPPRLLKKDSLLDPAVPFTTIIQPGTTILPTLNTPTGITPSSVARITTTSTPAIPQPTFPAPSQTPPNTLLIIVISFGGAMGLIFSLCLGFACYRSWQRRRRQNAGEQANASPEAGQNAPAQPESKQQGSNSLEANENGVSPFRSPSNHSTPRATGGQHTGASLGTSSGSTMHAGTSGRT
ncbi:uncharacterized protein F4812DRAFT_457684 [Daldinia caldariorum]|uniref:uncharacterized protein n=1 Tax=Daldinia caldariorum TaxID=326644 RepID=UPI0020077DC6|nr:uncharacterized protein F4812DRAFT_457684 [Daldinia caldariorum]KAI1469139.1 hypothetical protein F4812DRAFT_457684 [Daldinia caldariorum]